MAGTLADQERDSGGAALCLWPGSMGHNNTNARNPLHWTPRIPDSENSLEPIGCPFNGLGSPFKGLGSPFKGLGSRFKGLGSPFKGPGSRFKGLGSPFKGLGSCKSLGWLLGAGPYGVPSG